MFSTNIKVAWRNLIKTKGYSAINIGGLAVGIAIAILIGLWVYDEVSYNFYHTNHKRIAQVMYRGNFNGQKFSANSLMRPLEKVVRQKYGSHFRNIVMSRYEEEHILGSGEKKISQSGRYMQPGVVDLLSLRILKGSRDGLKDQSSIFISSTVATALFGNTDPIGQVLKIDNKIDVKVTGVYEDIPYNSEFSRLKFICPWDLVIANLPWMKEAEDKWGNTSFLMYVQIADNTTFAAVDAAIKNAIQDNVGDDQKPYNMQPFLYPMDRWHLYNDFKDGINTGGRIQFVWMFSIIGVFVLFLACINFMNLSTARSEKRAREVGVRKAIGSLRSQLVRQFLTESFVVVVIAFAVAILLVSLSVGWFNQLADKRMSLPWTSSIFWLLSFVFIIITSLVAGSYPAFYLSSFHPVKVLKGTFNAGRWAALPRKVLVVIQFTVSVALIIGTIIVYRQIQYAKNRPVGYERNGLISVQVKSEDLYKKYAALENELKSEGVITSMSGSSSPLTGIWSNYGDIKWRGKNPNQIGGFGVVWITHDYGKSVGWKFKEGRDFSREFKLDSISFNSPIEPVYSIVINEAAAKYMNFNKPVGEVIEIGGYKIRVIGVISDMLMESPFEQVRQTLYMVNYGEANAWINFRLNPGISIGDGLAKMAEVFKRVVPSVPFEYKFADMEYATKFAAEERIGKIAALFASLAVFISCLGLFGLASFVAEKRTKEIGIRKILGASVYNLWKMLSGDFVFLIVLSCAIAIPLAYYFLNQWLQQYEYRTAISWWVFVVAVAGAVLVTLITVSFQAIRAAISNPVKSLRTE